MIAVVKANAYGHGDTLVSSCLNQMGVSSFAVATLEEGIRLRKFGIEGEILILGYTPALQAKEIAAYDLTQTIADVSHAAELSKTGIPLKVQIKIDTGMHRLGITPDHKKEVASFFQVPTFLIRGIYTHLCASDSRSPEDIAFSRQQLLSFDRLVLALKNTGFPSVPLHVQSSYGILNYPNLHYNFARIGILLYGCHSQKDETCVLSPTLSPVLSLYSRIALIREIPSGETVGYGRAYKTAKNQKVGVIPIGYADGYPRCLSHQGYVLVNGQKADIIGRICMDQMMVDLTQIDHVCVGDRVTLIGQDGNLKICAEELAGLSNTITNELLSRLGDRITRVLVMD